MNETHIYMYNTQAPIHRGRNRSYVPKIKINKKTKTKTKCGKGTASTPKIRIDYTKHNVFGEAKCMFKC